MDYSGSEEAAALPYTADNTDKFSIVNDHTSKGVDTLTNEEKDLLAVRTKRTERHNNESEAKFLLTREAVVCFVHDSIVNAVDRQKRNADKNGRENVISFKVNELVLPSTVNLPGHVVTNVCSRKLLPRYIGFFRVVHRQSNAYTIELSRKMRTHPTFYVGHLRPYYQHQTSPESEYDQRAQESPTDSGDHGPNSHAGPSATQPCDEPPLARRASDKSRVRSQAELRELRSVLLSTGTEPSHGRQQIVPTNVLVLHVLPQLGQDAVIAGANLLHAQRLSRTLSFRLQ